MPVFALMVQIDSMDGVEKLEAPAEHGWCVDFRQSDGDEVRSGVVVCSDEEVEVEGASPRHHSYAASSPTDRYVSRRVKRWHLQPTAFV